MQNFIVNIRQNDASMNVPQKWYQTVYAQCVCSLLNIGLALYFLIWGVNHLDDYCEYNLPLWLIVAGSSMIFLNLFNGLGYLSFTPTESQLSRFKSVINKLFVAFQFAWAIVGSVWTYHSNSDQCDYTTFKTCYIYLIMYWVVIGVCLLIGCCIGAITAAVR